MEPDRSIVLIQGSDTKGHWYEAACDNEATVTYYLAQLAARRGHELHHDRLGRFYQIGPNDYDLYTLQLLDLATVGRLRQQHETERT